MIGKTTKTLESPLRGEGEAISVLILNQQNCVV